MQLTEAATLDVLAYCGDVRAFAVVSQTCASDVAAYLAVWRRHLSRFDPILVFSKDPVDDSVGCEAVFDAFTTNGVRVRIAHRTYPYASANIFPSSCDWRWRLQANDLVLYTENNLCRLAKVATTIGDRIVFVYVQSAPTSAQDIPQYTTFTSTTLYEAQRSSRGLMAFENYRGVYDELLHAFLCAELLGGNRDLDLIRVLVAHRLPVNAEDFEGTTAIMLACDIGRLDVVELLADHGACIERATRRGWTCLHYASRAGNLPIVRFLLDRAPQLIVKGNVLGMNALHFAVREGHMATTRLLLRYGADPHKPHQSGMTPIHFAAEKGRLAIVQLLMRERVDINATDDQGYTPLMLASILGHWPVVAVLCAAGAQIDETNTYGDTALVLATTLAQEGAVSALLNAGACPLLTNRIGCTALHCAVQTGRDSLVQKLMAAGTDPRTKNYEGSTALMLAARMGNVAIVKELLERQGLEAINMQNNYGMTALMFAASAGRTKTLEVLLKAGAEPSLYTPDGYTALIYAATGGHMRATRVLFATTKYSRRSLNEAIHLADSRGYNHIVGALRRWKNKKGVGYDSC